MIEAAQLPEKSEVYLEIDSYSDCGWRMIYPYKDREGNWLWKNILLGGSQNLFWVIFIVLLTIGFFYVYNHDTQEMQKVVANPCGYCEDCFGGENELNIGGLDGILERQGG